MEELLSLAKPVYEAVMSGQYVLAAAFALVLATAIAKKYLAPKIPFLNTDEGGSLLVLVGSFGGAFATAIMAGSVPSLALAWKAFQVAFAAGGGYSIIKRVLRWIEPKLPPSLRWLVIPANWILGSKVNEKKVKEAGDRAVKKEPVPGAVGIIGKIREID